jgi:putative nucleotidyltransferase with HDIG domain
LLSVAISIFPIIVTACVTGFKYEVILISILGSLMGILFSHKANQRNNLLLSGLLVGIFNSLAIFAFGFINTINIVQNSINSTQGIVGGFLSAVLAIGILPLFEQMFDIITPIKLLELSNPNQLLLKKMLFEAPGTYHHSLMVGNLAEASAESIGANPLLVRVGAYYHDIGKIKRPEYFVENQRGFDNPHEKIAPALSALIITSHVKEGLELARESRLPRIISDFIAQHHGTSLAKYFYSRALEEDQEGQFSEEGFPYEGPKPQTKEVALVMLADSIEAAVRSLQEPSTENIREMVRLIIRDKLNDRQLEECDLTFKDLDIIADSFCKLLEGIYHKRIEYPETIAKELQKRGESYGDHDNKSKEQS